MKLVNEGAGFQMNISTKMKKTEEDEVSIYRHFHENHFVENSHEGV